MRTTRATPRIVQVALLVLASGCEDKAAVSRPSSDASAGGEPAPIGPKADAGHGLDDAGTAGKCGARRLRCGDRIADSTPAQGENRLFLYGCTARAESGPESIYAFEPEGDCRVRARLSELAVDLDLFVLDRCDASSCIERSSTPLDLQHLQDGEVVTFDARPDLARLVVVDGYAQSSGSYALAVDCLCGDAAASFADGTFRLRVTRRWNHDLTGVTSPSTPLPEDDYAPVDDGVSYRVVIAEGWRRVTVETDGKPPLQGELAKSPAAGALHYELTSGAFAGGRVSIWTMPSGLEAELTLYGSGVPITSSERGSLVAEP